MGNGRVQKVTELTGHQVSISLSLSLPRARALPSSCYVCEYHTRVVRLM